MNNSSRTQSPARASAKSTENVAQNFGGITQLNFDLGLPRPLPGSMNDSAMVRGVLTEVMRTCGKSRAQIADEMSYLTQSEVTERRLNGFTAESKEDYRWPAELDRAFCHVTGDTRLLSCRAELAGMYVITAEQMDLLELGRAYQQQIEAEEKIAMLQQRIRRRVA